MAFRINTPIASMQSAIYLNTNSRTLDESLTRLSSGLRINSAADDASGMMIADSLRSYASSLGQACQNANDAIAIAQIADKAIDEQTKIIDTIKSKLIQSAQDGQSIESRQAIQADITRLLESYNSIATSTSYNSQSLLSGSFTNKKFQVGAQSDQTADLTVQPTTLSKIGTTSFKQSKQLPIDQTNPFGNTAINLNGVQLQEVSIGYQSNEGIGKLSDIINASSDETGVRSSYVVEHRFTVPNQALVGGITPSDFMINDVLIGAVNFENNDQTGNLVSAINAKSLETGIQAYTDEVGGLVLSSNDGRAIKLATNSPAMLETLKIAIPDSSFSSYQLDPPDLQVERFQLSGTVQTGDIYTIGNISYTVQPTDSTIDEIIDKLVLGLNGGTTTGLSGSSIPGTVASRDSSGVLKLASSSAGVPFASPSYSTTDVPSMNDQTLIFDSIIQPNLPEIPFQAEVQKTVQYSLSDDSTTGVQGGDIYTISIDGISTSYTVATSDSTVEDVIDGLLGQIAANPSLSSYTISKSSSSQIQIAGSSDFSVTSTQSKTPTSSITLAIASNDQENNIASNWRRASATLVLTNSTLDTQNVFTVGDTITFNYSPTVNISYTVVPLDIDVTDPTGANTNYNVLTKLKDLINADPSINGAITAESALEQNAPYTYYYSPGIPHNPALDLSVNNNIAVLNIYEDTTNAWAPLSGNNSFTLTGNVATNLYSNNATGRDGVSIINEIPIVQSIPEITTFTFNATQIVPDATVKISFQNGWIFNSSYKIKTTDLTIDDVISGINASMPTVHMIDNSNNTVSTKLANLVNNNDGTVTMTTYVTNYSKINTLNSTNISNQGSFSDSSSSYETFLYNGNNPIEDSITIQDPSTLLPTITTITPYTAPIAYQAPQQQIVKYTLSGTVESGDSYSLGNINYIVQPSDNTLSDIADKLVLGLNGGSSSGLTGTALSGITASKDINGDILLSGDVAGTAFIIPSSSASNVASNDQNIIKLPKSFNQYIELGGFNTVGKLKLVERATGAEIDIGGTGLQFIGMDIGNSTDQWVKNLLDINGLNNYVMNNDIFSQPIQESIDICDSAINQLDTIRSDIGSFQNQLAATIASISVERVMTLASESQIRDVDFASESANFNKHKLLAQAGSFALTQSNADLKRVMSLLQ